LMTTNKKCLTWYRHSRPVPIHAGKKELVTEYSRNFKSLWDMVEAFGGLPGLHRGLVDGWSADSANRVTDPGNPLATEKQVPKPRPQNL
jgi:hypothetical protein